MPDNQLFEYAVIRLVPKVEREEFLNTGVILYCGSRKFLQMKYRLNEERIIAFDNKTDIEEIRCEMQAYERICKGGADGGPIGQLPIAERFRWLTATRSTVLQTSKVHPGLCAHPELMLENLFRELVM